MKEITKNIQAEFERRTGYKVTRCHLNKGSMKEYVTIHIFDSKNEYDKLFEAHKIGDIQISFFGKSYSNPQKIWFDIKISEFEDKGFEEESVSFLGYIVEGKN